jgi:hypothetical protein
MISMVGSACVLSALGRRHGLQNTLLHPSSPNLESRCRRPYRTGSKTTHTHACLSANLYRSSCRKNRRPGQKPTANGEGCVLRKPRGCVAERGRGCRPRSGRRDPGRGVCSKARRIFERGGSSVKGRPEQRPHHEKVCIRPLSIIGRRRGPGPEGAPPRGAQGSRLPSFLPLHERKNDGLLGLHWHLCVGNIGASRSKFGH